MSTHGVVNSFPVRHGENGLSHYSFSTSRGGRCTWHAAQWAVSPGLGNVRRKVWTFGLISHHVLFKRKENKCSLCFGTAVSNSGNEVCLGSAIKRLIGLSHFWDCWAWQLCCRYFLLPEIVAVFSLSVCYIIWVVLCFESLLLTYENTLSEDIQMAYMLPNNK